MHKRLKYLRKEVLGKTQREMAEVLGIKEPAYSQIEQGKRPLRDSYIKILVYVHNVNEEWLRYGESEYILISPKLTEFMECFKKFNTKEQIYFLSMAREELDKVGE